MVKQVIHDDSLEEEELRAAKKSIRPTKGKLLSDPKPKDSARYLLDSPETNDSPVSVYKEKVTDADTGKTSWYVWWTAQNSVTMGRDDIVRVNEKTSMEKLVGYDFTIPHTPEIKKDLLGRVTAQTKFYLKDGRNRTVFINPEKDF